MINNNKILLTYFLYLSLACIFFLVFHINEFPIKYVFTDWLINYEGGFVRRGLLGQIIFEISKLTNIEIKSITLFFQISIYLAYFFLFYLLLSKRKINFFWLLIIFSPISFLYPIAELEALGRKDIFVISFFLIFSMINCKNINILLLFFILLFSLSTLIHEITIFYIFHYFFIFYIKSKFFIKQQIKKKHYLIIFIVIALLLYLNLYLHNYVVIEDIVNSYSYEDLTVLSGSFSHINPAIDSVLLKTLNNINIFSILRYGFLLLISVIPFIYFIKIKNKYENKYFNHKNICFILLLLSIPLYLLIFDWGRVIYINHNLFVIIIILIFNLDLVDKDYIKKKLQSLSRHIKVFIFILVCLLFSPKLLVTDDLGSKPLYKSATKIFKIVTNF
tara:strand:+ start:542 stop:1711 length:1170 start_codon:yes stop_codon:yes gene_type:complete